MSHYVADSSISQSCSLCAALTPVASMLCWFAKLRLAISIQGGHDVLQMSVFHPCNACSRPWTSCMGCHAH